LEVIEPADPDVVADIGDLYFCRLVVTNKFLLRYDDRSGVESVRDHPGIAKRAALRFCNEMGGEYLAPAARNVPVCFPYGDRARFQPLGKIVIGSRDLLLYLLRKKNATGFAELVEDVPVVGADS